VPLVVASERDTLTPADFDGLVAYLSTLL